MKILIFFVFLISSVSLSQQCMLHRLLPTICEGVVNDETLKKEYERFTNQLINDFTNCPEYKEKLSDINLSINNVKFMADRKYNQLETIFTTVDKNEQICSKFIFGIGKVFGLNFMQLKDKAITPTESAKKQEDYRNFRKKRLAQLEAESKSRAEMLEKAKKREIEERRQSELRRIEEQKKADLKQKEFEKRRAEEEKLKKIEEERIKVAELKRKEEAKRISDKILNNKDAQEHIEYLSESIYQTYLLLDDLCFQEDYIAVNKIKKFQDLLNVLANYYFEEKNIAITEQDSYKDAGYSHALENYQKNQEYKDMQIISVMAPQKMPLACTQFYQTVYSMFNIIAQKIPKNKNSKKRDF